MILWMLAVLCGYFVKGVTGFANTLVVSSIMTFSTANADISPVELLLSVPTNLIMAWKNRRAVNWRLCVPLLVMVLAGDAVGVMLLARVNAGAVKLIFGAVIVLLGAEMLWRDLRGTGRSRGNPVLLFLLGTAAGVLCGLFGVGALLAAYFSRVSRDDSEFKGSMCLIFAVENMFRVAAYGMTGLLTMATVKNAAMLAPCMGLGLLLGMRLCGRLNARLVKRIVMVMLMISGAAMLLTNL